LKTHTKIFISLILITLVIFFTNSFFIKNKTISVTLELPLDCLKCSEDLKKRLFYKNNFITYVKSKDWVESLIVSETPNTSQFIIKAKKPIFKKKISLYFDSEFKVFSMPLDLNLPNLAIDKNEIDENTILQAKIINNELDNLSQISYSALSGWDVEIDGFIFKLGKENLELRLIKINKILIDLKSNYSVPLFVDLRYKRGYVIKEIQ
tara:strand:- start:1136 stop:1759 length:624 start_codon:yes stop_codon:yes gene_type:complete